MALLFLFYRCWLCLVDQCRHVEALFTAIRVEWLLFGFLIIIRLLAGFSFGSPFEFIWVAAL